MVIKALHPLPHRVEVGCINRGLDYAGGWFLTTA
jgi:hypothetical protein